MRLMQLNPKVTFKWTKNIEIFSKRYLVILIQYTMVTIGFLQVWTQPHISPMILDSLYKEQGSVEVKITRYL